MELQIYTLHNVSHYVHKRCLEAFTSPCGYRYRIFEEKFFVVYKDVQTQKIVQICKLLL